MAYGTKYRFTFDSEQGSPFQILIKKNGYSGSVYDRAVGGSPVLRRDKSGCICGTSLEIPAECAVDNEFEEFKTSTPFTFLVELYGGTGYATLIWTGYVTPELMDAPDIAPPYDVQVSCTDGLGELKYTNFPANGVNNLSGHLAYLLGLTNLNLQLDLVNDIYHGSIDPEDLLLNTNVNLDFLAGESCYDVLQYILNSLHLTITQYAGMWLLFKETGAPIISRAGSNPYIQSHVEGSSTVTAITVWPYGSMSTHPAGWWPVGHISHSNEPPRKRMVLTCDNHYPSNLLSETWTAVSGGVDSGDYWTLATSGDGMKQIHYFLNDISEKLILSIKVRNVGAGADAGKLSVKVKAIGTSYAGSQTYYLANGSYGRRNVSTDFSWSASDTSCLIDVQAPASTDTDADYVTIGIVLPIYRNSARDYFYANDLEITVSNGDGVYEQRIYGVSLAKYEQFQGVRNTVDINNGARGDASDADLCFSSITGGNNYVGVQELQEGILMDANSATVTTWYSSAFSSGMDYLSLMSRDYALSIVSARTRKRGTLNVPTEHAIIPVAFQDDYDSTGYFVETFSWSLFNDELEVDMISLPATSLTVSGETYSEDDPTNATGHTQADSTSSGGGGGGGGTGTVTSVGVSVPTGMTVSGSPVTTSGVITLGLESGVTLHGHSNKGVLDTITAEETQNWDTAYQQAHTHSNMSVLDGITAAKVAQWDAASGGVGPDSLGIPVPVVTILGEDGNYPATINVWHPLLSYSTEAEAVLMTRGRKTKSKHGTAQAEYSNIHLVRKGWTVARSWTGSRNFSISPQQGAYVASTALEYVARYIARYYTYISGKTRAQMAAMSYASWQSYGAAIFGWERASATSAHRYRKLFGIAVRIPNPAFDSVVIGHMDLTEHCQGIVDSSGNTIPRYLYSAVAPILVHITVDSGMKLGFEVK